MHSTSSPMGCDDMAMAKVVLASVFFDFFSLDWWRLTVVCATENSMRCELHLGFPLRWI